MSNYTDDELKKFIQQTLMARKWLTPGELVVRGVPGSLGRVTQLLAAMANAGEVDMNDWSGVVTSYRRMPT